MTLKKFCAFSCFLFSFIQISFETLRHTNVRNTKRYFNLSIRIKKKCFLLKYSVFTCFNFCICIILRELFQQHFFLCPRQILALRIFRIWRARIQANISVYYMRNSSVWLQRRIITLQTSLRHSNQHVTPQIRLGSLGQDIYYSCVSVSR